MARQNGDHIKLNAALGKRLKTAVSDFGHLAGLPFLLILVKPMQKFLRLLDKEL